MTQAKGANVHDRISCGENYYINIRTNEKRPMTQAKGRMCMKEHGIAY